MICIQAPESITNIVALQQTSFYLAGGLSTNWRDELISKVDAPVTIYNPFRKDFGGTSEHQAIWEYMYLRRATYVIFWFCAESYCPMSLYELGCVSQNKKLIIGIEDGYRKANEITQQMQISRLDVTVFQADQTTGMNYFANYIKENA